MILYFVVGAVPLIVGLKISATSQAKAVLAILIATLAGVVGVLALVHALRFIGLRPDEWAFWTGDSVFWAVYISLAIFIGYHSLAVTPPAKLQQIVTNTLCVCGPSYLCDQFGAAFTNPHERIVGKP